MASTWLATARTSHPTQSVGFAQSSGVKAVSCRRVRSNSAAASRPQVARSSAGVRAADGAVRVVGSAGDAVTGGSLASW
jgi:hypothetical protein